MFASLLIANVMLATVYAGIWLFHSLRLSLCGALHGRGSSLGWSAIGTAAAITLFMAAVGEDGLWLEKVKRLPAIPLAVACPSQVPYFGRHAVVGFTVFAFGLIGYALLARGVTLTRHGPEPKISSHKKRRGMGALAGDTPEPHIQSYLDQIGSEPPPSQANLRQSLSISILIGGLIAVFAIFLLMRIETGCVTVGIVTEDPLTVIHRSSKSAGLDC